MQDSCKPYAKLVIMDERGRVLVLRRSGTHPTKPYRWDLAGGRSKPGERALAAARREAFEETGLRLGRITRVREVAGGVIAFGRALPGQHVLLSAEHDGYAWIGASSALPAHIAIVADLHARYSKAITEVRELLTMVAVVAY